MFFVKNFVSKGIKLLIFKLEDVLITSFSSSLNDDDAPSVVFGDSCSKELDDVFPTVN